MHVGNLPAPRSKVSNLVTSEGTCRPVTNFVFIKVHKTASGSTFMLLARFGRNHDMTICYPARRSKAKHNQLSYPSGRLTKKDCRPVLGRNYTLIIHHSIMNKPAMDQVMEPGTKYIGIVREPLNHFRSIFFWHQVGLRRKKNPLGAFLSTPNKDKDRQLGKNHPYSKHRNFQSYTLGFPGKLMTSKNTTQIYETIRTVASWYSMVIVTEYWEESLVLLKRKFCWTMYDILHTTRRLHALKKRKEHAPLTDKQKSNHKRISKIDYMMYDYFNNTFWQRVTEEGPEFWEEVTYYKTLNREVNQHCNSGGGKRVFPAGKWSQEFVIDSTFCNEWKWAEGRWAAACWDVVYRRNKLSATQKSRP
ncbi:GAL3ST3 [Branchiostoma lanceolatum]|uniref:GAL3ST3 protein n=1 Tax=Branchiostoma lanceolatum TaxID=7740 RepID=A0A8J9ZCB6_BRALA|nr:GAL3ST3 [Branchiostoma lanceolatum]